MGPYLSPLEAPLVPPWPGLCTIFCGIFHKQVLSAITCCLPSWTLLLHHHRSREEVVNLIEQKVWVRHSMLNAPTSDQPRQPPHCTVTAVEGGGSGSTAAVESQERLWPALPAAFVALPRPHKAAGCIIAKSGGCSDMIVTRWRTAVHNLRRLILNLKFHRFFFKTNWNCFHSKQLHAKYNTMSLRDTWRYNSGKV